MNDFNETLHPREAAGTPGGGRFTRKHGEGMDTDLSDTPPATPRFAHIIARFNADLDSGGLSSSEARILTFCKSDAANAFLDADRPEYDWRLAMNPNVPEHRLDDLIARQPDAVWERHIRSAICLRRVKSDMLNARCEEWTTPAYGLPADMRRACAINLLQSSTDQGTLSRLLKHYPSREAAGWAINNPHAGDLVLAQAVARAGRDRNNGFNIAIHVLEHPNAGHRTLTAVHALKPYDRLVEQQVYAHPAAVHHPTLPDWRDECSSDNYDAAIGMAANPRVTDSDAHDLHALGKRDVDEQLARNPHTPYDILDQLAYDRAGRFDHALAANPSLSPQRAGYVAARLFRNPDDTKVGQLLAANPSLKGRMIPLPEVDDDA